jgi:hypothetical protein
LSLENTTVASDQWHWLQRANHLLGIDLRGSRLSAAACDSIEKMTWLEYLDLSNAEIDSARLERLPVALPKTNIVRQAIVSAVADDP